MTIEMAQTINKYKIPYAALLVKVDSRKEAAAKNAKELLEGFDITVLDAQIPLLSAFEQAETEGVTVDQAIDQRGRANPRRMAGWSAYCSACKEIEYLYEEHKRLNPIQSPIGWDFTPMEQRIAA